MVGKKGKRRLSAALRIVWYLACAASLYALAFRFVWQTRFLYLTLAVLNLVTVIGVVWFISDENRKARD